LPQFRELLYEAKSHPTLNNLNNQLLSFRPQPYRVLGVSGVFVVYARWRSPTGERINNIFYISNTIAN